MYVLNDGTEVTRDEIEAAYNAGLAMLVHGNGDGHTTTGLMLDGEEIDTRDECYSMWDEVWTRPAPSLQAALRAAKA